MRRAESESRDSVTDNERLITSTGGTRTRDHSSSESSRMPRPPRAVATGRPRSMPSSSLLSSAPSPACCAKSSLNTAHEDAPGRLVAAGSAVAAPRTGAADTLAPEARCVLCESSSRNVAPTPGAGAAEAPAVALALPPRRPPADSGADARAASTEAAPAAVPSAAATTARWCLEMALNRATTTRKGEGQLPWITAPSIAS